ncbi:MAG: hypothetical protein GX271_09995 [Clostridiales bacterium]|nr:hypothetical protein [Clostridiales bacterium]
MKTKNSDIAVKIFLVVVAVILVGLIIAWSTGVFKDKKNDLNEGTERINNAISSMAEFDLLVYDGGNITGSLLLDLIDNANNGKLDVAITVATLESPTPAAYPTPIASKSDSKYINPNGIFQGKVNRNTNGVITGIIFTQQ